MCQNLVPIDRATSEIGAEQKKEINDRSETEERSLRLVE